jgi:2-amino-4-hydroxy-6-hydroxymethyldihydropteridine diphosphokinase
VIVTIALGSNLGDRRAHLQAAVDALAELTGQLRVSSVWETEPVGGPDGQGPYLNAVAILDAAPEISSWWTVADRIERREGRERTVPGAARTLDVDILDVDGQQLDSPDLVLPHPRAHQRAFVLAPWAELAPDAVIDGWGRVADLLASADTTGVHRRGDLQLVVPGQ